jgi:hypothetical protein
MIVVILVCLNLFVAFISTSVMANDVEHVFMGLDICLSPFEEISIQVLDPFLKLTSFPSCY